MAVLGEGRLFPADRYRSTRDLYNYLAHPTAFFHEVKGGGGVLEREGLIYLRTQAVLGVEVEHRAELLRGAHRSSKHVEVLERDSDRHHLWRRAGGRTEDDDPASRFGERDEGVEVLATDVVGREVYAPRHALELFGPVLRVVIDAAFGAEALGLIDLLVAT